MYAISRLPKPATSFYRHAPFFGFCGFVASALCSKIRKLCCQMKIRTPDSSKVVRASTTSTDSSDTSLPPHNKQHSSTRIPSGPVGPSVDCCCTSIIRLQCSRLVQLVAGLQSWSQAPTEQVAPTENYICAKCYPLQH